MRELSKRNSGVDHLIVIRGELVPFVILGHCQWTIFQLLGGVIIFVGLAAEDARQDVVGLLDFTNNNRF